ncbi:MAG: ATP-binding protein [Candidatus Eremiobacteraeota bacterium]|nr:ATP-binding protein [Candidatus Eremiobacteraeota bacterium]MBV9736996.1 ATP-binding protein [Candidatus Eremiobacteraeota bacterium]
MTQTTAGVVELRIPRRAEWVAVARLAVAAVANRLRFSIEEIEDVKLAVAEACTTCILQTDAGDQIEIYCETKEDGLTVRVRSLAGADQPSPLPAEPEPDARGALGIFLIQSLMDSVKHNAGRGTDLVMTKKVSE